MLAMAAWQAREVSAKDGARVDGSDAVTRKRRSSAVARAHLADDDGAKEWGAPFALSIGERKQWVLTHLLWA